VTKLRMRCSVGSYSIGRPWPLVGVSEDMGIFRKRIGQNRAKRPGRHYSATPGCIHAELSQAAGVAKQDNEMIISFATIMTMHPLKNEDSDKSDEEVARTGFDGGGGGGYDGSMRERITRLEAFTAEALRRFDRLEARVDNIGIQVNALTKAVGEVKHDLSEHRAATKQDSSDFTAAIKQDFSDFKAATKQDLLEHRLATKHDIDNAIRWIVGMMLAISMAAITIITFVLNYATPRAETAVPAATQPIVIYATAPPAGTADAPRQ
jgi:hypothetical protein